MSEPKNTKKRLRNKKEYTTEALQEAIEKVRDGQLSSYKASKLYNISRTTIENHVIGKSIGFKVGRPTLLSSE